MMSHGTIGEPVPVYTEINKHVQITPVSANENTVISG